MERDQIAIAKFTSFQDAHIARGILQSSGIESYISDENLDVVIGTTVSEGYRLTVNKDDEKRAIEIISRLQNRDSAADHSYSPKILIYLITTVLFLVTAVATPILISTFGDDYYRLTSADRYFRLFAISTSAGLLIGCSGIFLRKAWGWFIVTSVLIYELMEFFSVDFDYILKSYSVATVVMGLAIVAGVLVFYYSSSVISWLKMKQRKIVRLVSLVCGGVIFILGEYAAPAKSIDDLNSSYLTFKEDIAYFGAARYSGKLIEHYRNGQAEVIGNYFNGKRQGYWQEFFDDGALRLSCHYISGNLNESYFEYYPDGSVQTEGHYQDGLKEGFFVEYYPNYRRKQIRYFRNGLLDGECKAWLENGVLYEEGNYKSGEKVGLWKEWTDGVLFLEENFTNGKRNGLAKYYENGKLVEQGVYDMGQRSGMWEQFDGNGKIVSAVVYDSNSHKAGEEKK